jgi:hypothetical protein
MRSLGRLCRAARACTRRVLLPLALAACVSCALLDMSPLAVSAWSPTDSTLARMEGVVVRIEFSRAVNAVLAERAFSLTADDSTLPGRITWADDRTLVFLPDEPLRDRVLYEMRVSTTAEDLDGRDLSPEFCHTFTSRVDFTRPTVVSSCPADHGRVGDRLAPFSTTFSEPMDRASVAAAFSLSPSVAGYYSLSGDGTVFTFTPAEPLQWQTRYTVTIGADAADLQHNTLGAEHATHVFVGTDSTPPAVASVASADLSLILTADDPSDSGMTVSGGWESTQGLRVTFTEPVLTGSAASAIVISPTVRYEIGESAAERTGTLTYSFPDRLAYGTTYTVSIGSGVEDAQGNASPAPATYHFTVDGPSTRPPVITRVFFPSTAGDPATNTELRDYDAISLPDLADTFFDLYVDCAPGASVDRFSLARAFGVAVTNGAADISPFAVQVAPPVTQPAPDSSANEVVARVWVHVTNRITSGQVVLHVSTVLTDTRDTPLAGELVLPLNDAH